MREIKPGRPRNRGPATALYSIIFKVDAGGREKLENIAWGTRRTMSQVLRDLIDQAPAPALNPGQTIT